MLLRIEHRTVDFVSMLLHKKPSPTRNWRMVHVVCRQEMVGFGGIGPAKEQAQQSSVPTATEGVH